eukprot:TRINITY_DN2593_c0_g1_i2.p1 TRINITY_DN2593_c0_g1~~TRINITY_DN2593_c0_g1_i2.p1  ORF type:complete len:151 (-),score=22.00 TRINITY_DN2593_c0_g1_i2:832-1284(-)
MFQQFAIFFRGDTEREQEVRERTVAVESGTVREEERIPRRQVVQEDGKDGVDEEQNPKSGLETLFETFFPPVHQIRLPPPSSWHLKEGRGDCRPHGADGGASLSDIVRSHHVPWLASRQEGSPRSSARSSSNSSQHPKGYHHRPPPRTNS